MNISFQVKSNLYFFSRWLFLTVFLFTIYQSKGQKTFIEINPLLQWDSYPSFVSSVNSTTNSTIKMNGISWGVGINYKHSFKKNVLFKVGMGYYKYRFNDIQEKTHQFGRDARVIDYRDGTSTFGYVTNKYWYNTLFMTIGVEKLIKLKNELDFIIGTEISNYYTFSQRYNILANDKIYKVSDGRYFGVSSYLTAALQKRTDKKINFGPTIKLPIITLWKQDEVFPSEKNTLSRSKWLRGVGLGISCTYQLTSK